MNPKTKMPTPAVTRVFYFWSRLYPHRLFKDITEDEFNEMDRSIRRLRILWNQMKARCYNEYAQDYPYYGGQGIRVC